MYRPYMSYATVSQVQAHGSMHMNDIIHEINTVKIGHADLCLVTIKSLRCRKFEPFIIKYLNFVALILHPSYHTSHVSFSPVFHKQSLKLSHSCWWRVPSQSVDELVRQSVVLMSKLVVREPIRTCKYPDNYFVS